MILYYHLNNNSLIGENDTFVVDSSLTSNNGIVLGGAVHNNSGGYLEDGDFIFGASTKKIFINDLNINNISSFTLSYWVYPYSNTSQQGIFTTNDTNYNFFGRFNNVGRFDWNFPGLTDIYYQTTVSYPSKNWYHLTATYNGSTKIFYVNGIENGREISTGKLNMSANLQIGLLPNTGFFNGSIDEVIFWNKSLSEKEVSDRYLDYINGCNNNLTEGCFIRQNIQFQTNSYNRNGTSSQTTGIFNINSSNLNIDCNNSLIYGNYTPIILSTGTGSGVAFYQHTPSMNVTLQNCNIRNYHFGYVTAINSNVNTSIIRFNSFNQTSQSVRFYGGGNNLIYNNTFFNASNDGVYSGASTFNNNLIYNNYFLGGTDGVQIGVYPFTGTRSTNNTVYNNIFEYGYIKLGIILENTQNSIVRDNIFRHRTSPIGSGGGLINITYQNNYIFNVSNQTSQSCSDCKGFNFYQNPGFLDYYNITLINNTIIGAERGISFYNTTELNLLNNLIQNTTTYNILIRSNGNTTIKGTNYDSGGVTRIESLENQTNTELYNLTTSLIYFSNNSVACSDISNCDGNINITLTPNNYSYVLDNFNLTEGVTRQFSPLSISGTSTSKTITSQLSQGINATVVVDVPKCNFNQITYDGNPISPESCANGQAIFLLNNIPSGSSLLIISYSGGTPSINECDATESLFTGIASLGTIGNIAPVLVAVTAIVYLIFGFKVFRRSGNPKLIKVEGLWHGFIGLLMFAMLGVAIALVTVSNIPC